MKLILPSLLHGINYKYVNDRSSPTILVLIKIDSESCVKSTEISKKTVTAAVPSCFVK